MCCHVAVWIFLSVFGPRTESDLFLFVLRELWNFLLLKSMILVNLFFCGNRKFCTCRNEYILSKCNKMKPLKGFIPEHNFIFHDYLQN